MTKPTHDGRLGSGRGGRGTEPDQVPAAEPGTSSADRLRILVTLIPVAIALAVVCAFVLTGCGGSAAAPDVAAPTTEPAPIEGDAPASEPPATDPPTPTTTAPPSPDEEAVRAVLDRYWPAYLETMAAPDPKNPVLVELLTGDAAMTVLGRLQDMAHSRQHTVAPEHSVYEHHVLSIDFTKADLAKVRECVVDDLQLIQDGRPGATEAESATFLVDGDTVTAEYTTWLHRNEDGWRITVRKASEVLEGVRSCDIFSA